MKIFIIIIGFWGLLSGGSAQALDSDKLESFVTEMDFDSTAVDGKMKAPSGFYLQGRNKQSLQSMVKLRTNFREKLRNSKSAVKSVAK